VVTSAQRGPGRFVPGRRSLARFAKFVVVGGLGTLVNTGILVALHQYAHFALVAASVVASELAIAHNFLWNNYWTFERRGVSLSRFVRFNGVSLGGQCIAIVSLWMLVRYAGMHYVVANLVGIGLALLWNFAANVRWTWGRAPERDRTPRARGRGSAPRRGRGWRRPQSSASGEEGAAPP